MPGLRLAPFLSLLTFAVRHCIEYIECIECIETKQALKRPGLLRKVYHKDDSLNWVDIEHECSKINTFLVWFRQLFVGSTMLRSFGVPGPSGMGHGISPNALALFAVVIAPQLALKILDLRNILDLSHGYS